MSFRWIYFGWCSEYERSVIWNGWSNDPRTTFRWLELQCCHFEGNHSWIAQCIHRSGNFCNSHFHCRHRGKYRVFHFRLKQFELYVRLQVFTSFWEFHEYKFDWAISTCQLTSTRYRSFKSFNSQVIFVNHQAHENWLLYPFYVHFLHETKMNSTQVNGSMAYILGIIFINKMFITLSSKWIISRHLCNVFKHLLEAVEKNEFR